MSSESTKRRVVRNSIYLTIQPLILNAISIAVIGYIARKLGTSDFGIFNFISVFTMLFYPIGVMGLDNVAIRRMASIREDRSSVQSYFSNILSLRMFLAFLMIFIIFIVANIIGYSERIINAVYLGTAIVLFQLLGESITDIFRSYERMEFVALAQLIGGITLTILSVVILCIGYGLFELIGVYAFGQLLIVIIAIYINEKHFIQIRLKFDLKFYKEVLLEGFPFFLMATMWFVIERMDTVFISKFVSTEELGFYTTSFLLVNRLGVIPTSIAGSLYPTFSGLSAAIKKDEIENIIRKYFKFALIIATPLFILISFYSDQIILIIFGEKYIKSGVIFRYVIWYLFIRLFASVAFSFLAANRKQKLIVIVYLITLIFCLAVNLIFTIKYKIPGAIIAFISTQLVMAVPLLIYVSKEIQNIFNFDLIKVVFLNICIVIFVSLINNTTLIVNNYSNLFMTSINIIIISIITLIFYIGMLILFKIVKAKDLFKLKHLLRRNKN